MKVSKTTYLQSFGIICCLLALVRCAIGIPGRDATGLHSASDDSVGIADALIASQDTTADTVVIDNTSHRCQVRGGYHPIYSVPNYSTAFPDSQEVQMVAAQQHGIPAVMNRQDAEHRKNELVYAGASPYFAIDDLKSSLPYLVPRAYGLLNDIGRTFYDSLYVKGIPLHEILVTSVLRSKEDVDKLRTRNHNATENSCHMYGTTFDISYSRYITVQNPRGPQRHEVRNDTLKWVLSEVLRDMRQQGRCYVKHERKQGCYHITVR